MKIIEKLLPISLRRSGIKNDGIKYIVCHDTGNLGSTAIGNVNYYIQSANEIQASAHYFVDDKEVVCCIPETEKAWHVRYISDIDNKMYHADACDASLGIELCFGGGIDNLKAYENYCTLIASLCKKYDLDPLKDLVAHSTLDPSRRTDPQNAFSRILKTWSQFLEDVQLLLKEKHMENTIKFVNFYGSDNSRVTYFTNTRALQNDGETHDFSSGEEALEKSTSESFVFWDNTPMGVGKLN